MTYIYVNANGETVTRNITVPVSLSKTYATGNAGVDYDAVTRALSSGRVELASAGAFTAFPLVRLAH